MRVGRFLQDKAAGAGRWAGPWAGRWAGRWFALSAQAESVSAHVARLGAQFLFDAEELVVLGGVVGAGHRSGLDLAAALRLPTFHG